MQNATGTTRVPQETVHNCSNREQERDDCMTSGTFAPRAEAASQTEPQTEGTREVATPTPKLVFLHGSGDDARLWQGVIAALPEFESLALDLPGHGALLERPGPTEMSVADYANAVRAELTRRGLSQVTLVGHSLGSAIALRLATDYPALVARLVLVGSGARLRVLPEMLSLAQNDPSAASSQLMKIGFTGEHARLREMYSAEHAPVAPGILYRDLAACDAFDVMEQLGMLAQPTLIASGEFDQLTPAKYARYLAANITDSSLVLVPNTGHYLPVEAPEALAAAIRAWLCQAH